jgi:hypothetical protein
VSEHSIICKEATIRPQLDCHDLKELSKWEALKERAVACLRWVGDRIVVGQQTAVGAGVCGQSFEVALLESGVVARVLEDDDDNAVKKGACKWNIEG